MGTLLNFCSIFAQFLRKQKASVSCRIAGDESLTFRGTTPIGIAILLYPALPASTVLKQIMPSHGNGGKPVHTY